MPLNSFLLFSTQYLVWDFTHFTRRRTVAFATNSVSVNGTQAYRKGEYFWKQVEADNTSAAVYPQITVSSGTSNIIGNVFLPKTEEIFAYDADGNLTNDGRWSYTWDGENRLTAMAANTAVGPQISLKFEYDHRSRRTRKQVWSNATWNGNSTNDLRFPYDGWNLLATLNSQLSTLNSFLWGLDLSGSEQGAGGVGGLLAVWDSATLGSPSTHFASFDGNGNLSALVNAANGAASAQFEYGPFAETVRATGQIAKANPFQFSTKYQDVETDLVYYGYRYYNASNGRWLIRDPLGDEWPLNLYEFARANPVCLIDIDGRRTYDFRKLNPGVSGFAAGDNIIIEGGAIISVLSGNLWPFAPGSQLEKIRCLLGKLGYSTPAPRNGVYHSGPLPGSALGMTLMWHGYFGAFDRKAATFFEKVQTDTLRARTSRGVVTRMWHEMKGHNADFQADSVAFDVKYEDPVYAAWDKKFSKKIPACACETSNGHWIMSTELELLACECGFEK